MIKSIVNIVLIVGCILSFSCGSSSSIRDKIFQDDTEDESEKDIEWVYYHPLDTMSITMRMNLFIDSINTFLQNVLSLGLLENPVLIEQQ
ncbi:MAG: hypothetical protein IPK11_17600 [Ignavibacteria bacterium]|nr:hypothetical protein [Ignavibacteria bacterium]